MTPRGQRTFVFTGLAALALFLIGLVPLVWSNAILCWVLRAAAAGCFAVTAVGLARSPSRMLLLCPIYLIGVIALVFYSWVPAIYVALFFDPAAYPFDLRDVQTAPDYRDGVAVPRSHGATVPFVGSIAEWVVFQFALLCLMATHVVYALSSVRALSRAAEAGSPQLQVHPTTFNAVVAVGLAASLGAILSISSVGSAFAVPTRDLLWREIFDAAPVVASFCLAYAAFAVQESQRWDWIRLGILAVGSLSSFALLVPKRVVAMIAVAGGVVLAGKGLGVAGRRVLAGCLVGAMLLVFSGVMLSRGHGTSNIGGDALRFVQAVAYYAAMKGVFRQGETGYCLKNVIAQHADGNDHHRPFYFFEALAPRVIWPEKPVLSRGDEYAVRYCAYGPLNPESVHSASITLLGEPMIYGGRLGLALAVVTLVLGLSMISAMLINGPFLGRVLVIALVPMLVDFDQSFALYLAIAVKSALIMLPVALLCAYLDRLNSAEYAGRRFTIVRPTSLPPSWPRNRQ